MILGNLGKYLMEVFNFVSGCFEKSMIELLSIRFRRLNSPQTVKRPRAATEPNKRSTEPAQERKTAKRKTIHPKMPVKQGKQQTLTQNFS